MNNYTGTFSAVDMWYSEQNKRYDTAYSNGYHQGKIDAINSLKKILVETSNLDLGLCDAEFVINFITAKINEQIIERM